MMMWWWQLWPWPLPWPLIIAAMILCAGMMFLTMHVIEMMDRHRPPDSQPPEPSG
jgi:hypothetical protein